MNRIVLNREAKTSHVYDVYVKTAVRGHQDIIEVHANNSTQAGSIAKKAGYEVCSVNMIG